MARKTKKKKINTMGFRQAFTYVLDLLCYAYYVKQNNFVSDQCFDELEKIYCKIFDEKEAPNRSREWEGCYSTGVKVCYEFIIKEKKIKGRTKK